MCRPRPPVRITSESTTTSLSPFTFRTGPYRKAMFFIGKLDAQKLGRPAVKVGTAKNARLLPRLTPVGRQKHLTPATRYPLSSCEIDLVYVLSPV